MPTTRQARRVVLVGSSLARGGAERAIVTMGEYWAARGLRTTILTLRTDIFDEYPVPPGVILRRLPLIVERNPLLRFTNATALLKLRRHLLHLEPDLVVSFMDKLNVAVILALAGTGVPVVATEHLPPWMNPLGRVWETLRRFCYRFPVAVVSPTQAITDAFSARGRGRFVTLPPPFAPCRAARCGLRERLVVAVGRLVRQKAFDQLIAAFSQVVPRHAGWRLEIAGEGPERSALEAQIDQAGLAGQAVLLGSLPDVYSLYNRAEVFVLSSRYEAYPNVLCEALSAGLCVVATDCPTGPREILGDSGAGLLVPPNSVSSLAEALDRVMSSPALRSQMAGAAKKRAHELEPISVMPAWDAALEDWIGGTE